ncbi:uncharacterized protein SRS1_13835 [Sporisorium reilianum f. sp. reilianum]|uniref:Mig1 protein n=1 Tax=Sporisorium reilianum f. sp. reilianum TaxID=72559 RepID=A0A2N8UE51_9BASI|nr:uncharacterized protein SRS1_13835 [Sporisorium reilianum f. sp. reilianum]
MIFVKLFALVVFAAFILPPATASDPSKYFEEPYGLTPPVDPFNKESKMAKCAAGLFQDAWKSDKHPADAKAVVCFSGKYDLDNYDPENYVFEGRNSFEFSTAWDNENLAMWYDDKTCVMYSPIMKLACFGRGRADVKWVTPVMH